MTSKPRYLTKSRFKLACECPTKLFYTRKESVYADQKLDDPFLLALADGGYQVGELAKYYYPGGHDITSLDFETSLEQTNSLMAQDVVTIYEAAVKHDALFIRADILNKDGNRIDLIEVKAKSFDADNPDVFLNKKDGTLSSKWKAYLYDVAFQKYVISKAYSGCHVHAYLLLVDKTSECPIDGLNQMFRIVKDDTGRRSVQVEAVIESAVAQKMLHQVNVDEYCELIFNNQDAKETNPMSFEERIKFYSEHYASDIKIDIPVSSACKTCEFKAGYNDGLKSGFHECWSTQLGWTEKDFEHATSMELWDNRVKDKYLREGKYLLVDLFEDDIKLKSDDKPGLSRSERQWKQIEKARHNDEELWIDIEGLNQEMSSWTYPLHFIDFETSAPALPFIQGRRPYEGIAFQYSHHTIDKDGYVRHEGQYINTERGILPNYDFVRSLKTELESDEGTILRYATHENTYLNMIYRQLQEDPSQISDRQELCDFIESITHVRGGRAGDRDMVDMLDMVKRYYFDPECGGSNSIKQILPSILNRSGFLKDKYCLPIYGASDGIPSLNFQDKIWVKKENGQVVDPYLLLPTMFSDVSKHDMKIISEEDELKDGAAAMMAYARMQFESMSDYELNELEHALLKYCELDTLAMVMIYEGWLDYIN